MRSYSQLSEFDLLLDFDLDILNLIFWLTFTFTFDSFP